MTSNSTVTVTSKTIGADAVIHWGTMEIDATVSYVGPLGLSVRMAKSGAEVPFGSHQVRVIES